MAAGSHAKISMHVQCFRNNFIIHQFFCIFSHVLWVKVLVIPVLIAIQLETENSYETRILRLLSRLHDSG